MSDQEALIKYRMDQANESLRDARILFQQGSYRGSVNRSYYGMFYSILALLVSKGLASSKHSGAIGIFDREFVKTGEFSKQESQWLHELFELRQRTDYREMFSISKERAKASLDQAESFHKQVKEYLDKHV